jgi:integrase
VRPNELRHTTASLLSDRGVPHVRIADLLGHVDANMVTSTYRHNLHATVDATVADLGNLTRPIES